MVVTRPVIVLQEKDAKLNKGMHDSVLLFPAIAGRHRASESRA